MTAFQNHCPHLDSVGEITKEDLIQKSHGTCQDCKVRGPNLWACLENRCSYVGCGESQVDHSTIHSQETKHYLTVNLTTLRVWCYACSKEVFLDRKLGTQPSLPHVRPLHQTQENNVQDFKIPSNTTLKTPLFAVFGDLDIEVEEEDELKARGRIILLYDTAHLFRNLYNVKFQNPEVKRILQLITAKKRKECWPSKITLAEKQTDSFE